LYHYSHHPVSQHTCLRSTHLPYTTLFRSEYLPETTSSATLKPRNWMNLKYTVKMIAATMSQMTTSGTGPIAKKTMLPKTVTKGRSEEHTSELQSRFDLVCRLLLEKKK